jgi:hypothetical protein
VSNTPADNKEGMRLSFSKFN